MSAGRGARGLGARRRNTWLVLTGLIAGTLLLNLQWLIRYRSGTLTELDEAGYVATTIRQSRALGDGLHAFAGAVIKTDLTSPLVPFFTLPFHWAFGPGLTSAWAPILLCSALLIVTTYALAVVLMPPPWALASALVVATLPGVTDYTRIYHFAVPATLALTVAVLCAVRSDRFRRRDWAVAAGVALGAMALCRTMTLAYVPLVVVGGAVQLLIDPRDRRARVRNLAWLALTVVVVAAPWYAINWGAVSEYLFGYGYGAEATRFGPSFPLWSPLRWLVVLVVAAEYLFAPLVLALAACAGALARQRGARRTLRGILESDALIPAVVVLGGFVALSTTNNLGSAFSLPLLPCLVLLPIAAASRITASTKRLGLATVLVGASLLNVVAKAGVSQTASASVYGLPSQIVAHDNPFRAGFDLVQSGMAFHDGRPPLPPARSTAADRRWDGFFRVLVRRVDDLAHAADRTPSVLVSTGDWMIEGNRLQLAGELVLHRTITAAPVTAPDTVASYADQLTALDPSILLTTTASRRQMYPVTVARFARAARALGYAPAGRSQAPDGRTVVLWAR